MSKTPSTPSRDKHHYFVTYVVKTQTCISGVIIHNNNFQNADLSVATANERSVKHFELLRQAIVELEEKKEHTGSFEIVIINSTWLHADF